MEKKETAVLAVSFGTSYENTRKKTLDVIEREMREAYPDRAFYRAWTSDMIRKKIREHGEKFLEILMSMGETIGYLDKEMQEKTIGFAIEQIEDVIFQMKDQVIKNCRMYRSLGLSFGLLVVIILV